MTPSGSATPSPTPLADRTPTRIGLADAELIVTPYLAARRWRRARHDSDIRQAARAVAGRGFTSFPPGGSPGATAAPLCRQLASDHRAHLCLPHAHRLRAPVEGSSVAEERPCSGGGMGRGIGRASRWHLGPRRTGGDRKAMIEAQEYRFLSPVLILNGDGWIKC